MLVDSGAHTHVCPKGLAQAGVPLREPGESLQAITGKRIHTWDKAALAADIYDERTARFPRWP
eukprot:8646829-Alexandrium_andersonii.AAC.1